MNIDQPNFLSPLPYNNDNKNTPQLQNTITTKRKRSEFQNKIRYNFEDTFINLIPDEVACLIFKILNGKDKNTFVLCCKSYKFIADTYYRDLNKANRYAIWDEHNLKCTISKRMIYFTNHLFKKLFETHRSLMFMRNIGGFYRQQPNEHYLYRSLYIEEFKRICDIINETKEPNANKKNFKAFHIFKLCASFLDKQLSQNKYAESVKKKIILATEPYLKKDLNNQHNILNIYIEMIASGKEDYEQIIIEENTVSKFYDLLKNYPLLKNLRAIKNPVADDWKQIIKMDHSLHPLDYKMAAKAYHTAEMYIDSVDLWKNYLSMSNIFNIKEFEYAFPSFFKSNKVDEFSDICLEYINKSHPFSKFSSFKTISAVFENNSLFVMAAKFYAEVVPINLFYNAELMPDMKKLGLLYDKAEQFDKAAIIYKKIIKLLGDNVTVKDFQSASAACSHAKQYKDAAIFGIKSLEVQTDTPPPINELKIVRNACIKAELFEKAAVYSIKIYNLLGSNATVEDLKELSNILYKAEQFENAANVGLLYIEKLGKEVSFEDLQQVIIYCNAALMFENSVKLYLEIESKFQDDLTLNDLLQICHVFSKTQNFVAISDLCMTVMENLENVTVEDLKMAIIVCNANQKFKEASKFYIRLIETREIFHPVELLKMANACQKVEMFKEAARIYLKLNSQEISQLDIEHLKIAADICFKAEEFNKAADFCDLIMDQYKDYTRADPDDILFAYRSNAKAGRYASAIYYQQYENMIRGNLGASYGKLFNAMGL